MSGHDANDSRVQRPARSSMIYFRKPSALDIQEFRHTQAKCNLTYAAVGTTATTPPEGYVVDHTRIRLGEGEQTFSAARVALSGWEHFQLGWVEALPASTPIQEGEVIAIQARLFGMWWLNSCRIIYVVNQQGPVTVFGFAYGTLPDHAETGEERFQVEWHREQGDVWYDILAFSRPRHFLARLGYPLTRRMQKRFARDSAAAMRRCVARNSG